MLLSSLRSPDGLYKLAGWNDTEYMAKLFGLDFDDAETRLFITQLQHTMLLELQDHLSGVVLDPRIGIDALPQKPPDLGVALRLTEYQTPETIDDAPKLLANWGVDKVKNNYAAAYLRLFYHPDEAAALDKKQFLAEIHDFCQYEDIDLVLDLALTQQSEDENRENVFLQTLSELRGSCSMMAIDYPGSPLMAATTTAELDIPWIVSSSSESYDEFKQEVRDCVDGGAEGYLVSQALYASLESARNEDHSPNVPELSHLVSTSLRDRVIELERIAEESRASTL